MSLTLSPPLPSGAHPLRADEELAAGAAGADKQMLQYVSDILAPANLTTLFPDLTQTSSKIVGFGWDQGWGDNHGRCLSIHIGASPSASWCVVSDSAFHGGQVERRVRGAVHGRVRAEHGEHDRGFAEGVEEPDDGGLDSGLRLRWLGDPAAQCLGLTSAPPRPTALTCSAIDHASGSWGGGGSWQGQKNVRRVGIIDAQFGACNKTRHPTMTHCVSEETRSFWRDFQQTGGGPVNQGYHWWHNAESYWLIGQAMGAGMLKAMQG